MFITIIILIVIILSIVIIIKELDSRNKPIVISNYDRLINLASEKTSKVNVSKYFRVMTKPEFNEYERCLIKGTDNTWLTEVRRREFERRLIIELEKDHTLNSVAILNNKGIQLEKTGKIKEAIRVYEQNIKSNYPAYHSYDRLTILYRKNNQYNDELRIIEKALIIFKNDKKYLGRLKKVKSLINQ